MRCKIVRSQKLMWRNIMRSIKSQKASILHYSINYVRLMHPHVCFKERKTNGNLENAF